MPPYEGQDAGAHEDQERADRSGDERRQQPEGDEQNRKPRVGVLRQRLQSDRRGTLGQRSAADEIAERQPRQVDQQSNQANDEQLPEGPPRRTRHEQIDGDRAEKKSLVNARENGQANQQPKRQDIAQWNDLTRSQAFQIPFD